jgi:hypothetical protein
MAGSEQGKNRMGSFKKKDKAAAEQIGLDKLAEGCGPSRMPCLFHSALNPYRPVLKITGQQSEVVSALEGAGIQFSEETQGDRFGSVAVNGRQVFFGLIITVQGSAEVFVEVAKYDAYDNARELEDLKCIYDDLRKRITFAIELLEK